ncbi:hypothetical protein EYC80_007413 [Monilinia laxa]|uniref:Uncharacterized protein n=1 Tax=Monilinia laxa TaxID=61186 RepID=A0A5N6JVY0_MONLA|nr:hypothetical protein EYC80_007413 [Monilinia laxa]
MWFLLLTRNPLYTKLANSLELETKDHETTRQAERKTRWNVLLLLAFSIASGTLGFVFARVLERQSVVSGLAGPKFTKQLTTFSYNRDFSYPPSNTTEIAWNGLFPEKVDSKLKIGRMVT